MQLDQSSIISILSGMITAGLVIYATIKVSENNIKNLKESLAEFKTDIKSEITKEKSHAMELAGQRMRTIEKDLDEIWPRFKIVEDTVNKNCYVLTTIQNNCIRHHKEAGI